jgi:hypothetical protein
VTDGREPDCADFPFPTQILYRPKIRDPAPSNARDSEEPLGRPSFLVLQFRRARSLRRVNWARLPRRRGSRT